MPRRVAGLPGMTCILEAEPSKMKIFRLQDSCSARIHRKQCSGTSRHGTWFCRDTVPGHRLCNVAARWGASAIPTHRPLCECSWTGSIAGASAQKQGEEPCRPHVSDKTARSRAAQHRRVHSSQAQQNQPTRLTPQRAFVTLRAGLCPLVST